MGSTPIAVKLFPRFRSSGTGEIKSLVFENAHSISVLSVHFQGQCLYGGFFMDIYQSIADLANEIGCSPDFVLTVTFWVILLLGVGVSSGVAVLVKILRRLFERLHH